ncbi:MAG: acyl-CoA dehydrogenase family protein [bacterium]
MRQFTTEQNLFRENYRRFLEKEIVPHIDRWREAGIVDRRAFELAGAQGMLMVWPDEKYGGLGDDDFRYEQIIIEETTRAGAGEWFNSLHSRLVGRYFHRFGSPEQKQRFLPDCVAGKKILAIAMTEPGAGSDLAAMTTTLQEDGEGYILNGTKTFISNGINADIIIVAAKVAGADNPHAVSLVIVERGMAGFERGKPLDKMGLKAQDTAELFFRDVRIPKENLLGQAGHGFFYLMEGLAEERLIAAAGFAANARAAFDVTRDYVMSREAFGKPVSAQQNTRFQMADMDTEIDIVQVYVDHCVTAQNAGQLTAIMGAKAKLMASEVEWKMVDLGVQLHGGAGYMMEYPIASMFLNARISRIYAGTSEIMRLIIGREIFSQSYKSLLE